MPSTSKLSVAEAAFGFATGLTDHQVEVIEATLPECPTCGGGIALIHFLSHQTHRFEYEIDATTGDVLAASWPYETVESWPMGRTRLERGVYVKEITVECERGHAWHEPRLKYDETSARLKWTVVPVRQFACGSRGAWSFAPGGAP